MNIKKASNSKLTQYKMNFEMTFAFSNENLLMVARQ